jgi:DNA-binding response OmpR family regulator
MVRILVVEDEVLIAMMLGDWLTEMGHELVGPAHTVAEALKLIESSAPAAALIDVNLHGEKSDAIADVLAARNVPMAFATGMSSDAISERFSNSLALAKPYDYEAIRNVVEKLLSRSPG